MLLWSCGAVSMWTGYKLQNEEQKSLDIHHELMMPFWEIRNEVSTLLKKTWILFKGSLSANAIQSRNRNGPASEQQTPKSSDLARRSWYKHAGVGLPSVEKSLSEFSLGLKGWCSYLINPIPHEYAFSSKWQLANHWHIGKNLLPVFYVFVLFGSRGWP